MTALVRMSAVRVILQAEVTRAFLGAFTASPIIQLFDITWEITANSIPARLQNPVWRDLVLFRPRFCDIERLTMAAMAKRRRRLSKVRQSTPIVRAYELRQAGIEGKTISRVVENGYLIRISRGLYQRHDTEVDTEQALAEAAKRVPKGIIAMVTALAYHGLTDQMPRRSGSPSVSGTGPNAILSAAPYRRISRQVSAAWH